MNGKPADGSERFSPVLLPVAAEHAGTVTGREPDHPEQSSEVSE